tara:strand:+ start:133 stop:765 length:633 start_codon:yes stop_codon:yes gene_type:complete
VKVIKSSIYYGVLLGLLMIFLQLITSGNDDMYLNFVNLALILILMFFFIKRYRDLELGGSISFSQSLRYGVSISVFASILVALYTVASIEYINPEIVDDTIEARTHMIKKEYEQQKLIEDSILNQKIIEWTDSIPEISEETIKQIETNIRSLSKNTYAKIQDEENQIRKFFQPFWVLILSILSVTFYGFIYSLIISFFVKKEEPVSNNTN